MAERQICVSTDVVECGLAFRFGLIQQGRERQAILIRFQGVVYGYLNECAHIPIELDYNLGDVFDLSRQYLVCSTHGAYYDPRNGLCLGGPCAGQRLQSIAVFEQDEAIWLTEEGNRNE
ncbi:Rieske 2Fe-2S domain-containing protein [uncultured Deefgea sp.]|uniref:Rieske (2Fe-2S) protein n=1 Tax=uncultured Deefgea sp. TaxID=1304914 RepID=UPI002593E279|nr:Rieske 2Fe-2S domain-containing protein [uncultured Deefgea sp.]